MSARLGGQHDPEPAAADVPAEHVGGVRVERAAGVDDVDAALALRRPVAADHDDRRGAVAEQPAGDDVRHRVVALLQRQRAQLDGHQQRDVVRVPLQVVADAGDPGGAGDAAEPEHRHALDVRAQAEAGDQQRVERRRADAGDRREEQVVDVRGGRARRRRARAGTPRRPASVPSRRNASLAAVNVVERRRTRRGAARGGASRCRSAAWIRSDRRDASRVRRRAAGRSSR